MRIKHTAHQANRLFRELSPQFPALGRSLAGTQRHGKFEVLLQPWLAALSISSKVKRKKTFFLIFLYSIMQFPHVDKSGSDGFKLIWEYLRALSRSGFVGWIAGSGRRVFTTTEVLPFNFAVACQVTIALSWAFILCCQNEIKNGFECYNASYIPSQYVFGHFWTLFLRLHLSSICL